MRLENEKKKEMEKLKKEMENIKEKENDNLNR